MFAYLKRMYDDGLLTIAALGNAVKKGWITPAQYKDICGGDDDV